MTTEEVRNVIREYAEKSHPQGWRLASVVVDLGRDKPAEVIIVCPDREVAAPSHDAPSDNA